MSPWNNLAEVISQTTKNPFTIARHTAVGGGCINDAYRLEGQDGRRYFVKLNQARQLAMFEAEAEGLREIHHSGSIRTPRVISCGTAGEQTYLILEHLTLGRSTPQAMAQLGRDLAQMHRRSHSRFGWHRDNTIGATPQHNEQSDQWSDFWSQHRLGFQLALAAQRGYGSSLQKKGDQLIAHIHLFFQDYSPTPSLLHGDLWSGNYAITDDGTPVVFDPAIYFGDRETDLAMTELFGGFTPAFYQAYQAAYPLHPGYEQRKTLYNLYHILNHLNLFGSGYLGQAEAMLDQLLRHCRQR